MYRAFFMIGYNNNSKCIIFYFPKNKHMKCSENSFRSEISIRHSIRQKTGLFLAALKKFEYEKRNQLV